MSGLADRDWRDRAAMEYLEALDSGDAEAFATLWERAAADPELEAFLRMLGEGIYETEGPGADFEADAERVRAIAFKHLPAFTPPATPAGPVTAAEVARRLQADDDLGGRLDEADRLANADLLAREEPLPESRRRSDIEAWGRSLGVQASARYWNTFHKAAVMIEMARDQQTSRLAAARPADPKGDTRGGGR